MHDNNQKSLVAFKEVTFTKILVIFFSFVFVGTLICSIVLKFTNPDITILEELRITATISGGCLGGYMGKSGYEYYSRSRYGNSNMQHYLPTENISNNSGGLQI